MLFKRFTFYLALAGIVGVIFMVNHFRKTPPPPPLPVEPARSPFPDSVAATGIIEAIKENVKVATSRPGLVIKVFVAVGTKIKAGDPLFQLDNREAGARLRTAQSPLESLKAALRLEEVQTADIADQLNQLTQLEKDKVISQDELKRKQFSLDTWRARIAKAKVDIEAAAREVDAAEVDLEILTVRAARDGTLLQLNIREGEYANIAPSEPLMILGELDKLQIRADVDEQNAPLIQPDQPAVAFLKGSTKNSLPLKFLRIEPYVVPKRSLTGDSAERVDTRVLQIIFELDRPVTPLYVGQQVDVFIKRADESTNAVSATASASR